LTLEAGQREEETRRRRPGREDSVATEDRGFASMDRGKQREIASKGGKAAHQKGTAHERTSEEAREAGRKGGMASHRRKQGSMTSDESQSRESSMGSESASGWRETQDSMTGSASSESMSPSSSESDRGSDDDMQ